MLTEETTAKLKRFFAIKWVIYSVLVISIFMYFIVTIILKQKGIRFLEDDSIIVILRNIFAVIAAVIMLTAFCLRRNLTQPEKFLESIEKKEIDPAIIEKLLGKIADDSIRSIGKVLLISNTIDIISWVLFESVAIFGFVLSFLTGDILYVQAFGAAALVAMALTRPNYTTFMNIVNHASSA